MLYYLATREVVKRYIVAVCILARIFFNYFDALSHLSTHSVSSILLFLKTRAKFCCCQAELCRKYF